MWLVRVRKENFAAFKKVRMWRKTLTLLITVCCISHHHCDNRINDRYNQLVTSDNLKKAIDAQLPKQSKFFDMNDFDCKFLFLFWLIECRMYVDGRVRYQNNDDLLLSIFFGERRKIPNIRQWKAYERALFEFIKSFFVRKFMWEMIKWYKSS